MLYNCAEVADRMLKQLDGPMSLLVLTEGQIKMFSYSYRSNAFI